METAEGVVVPRARHWGTISRKPVKRVLLVEKVVSLPELVSCNAADKERQQARVLQHVRHCTSNFCVSWSFQVGHVCACAVMMCTAHVAVRVVCWLLISLILYLRQRLKLCKGLFRCM
jgi:hypothetical protein